MEVPSLLVTLSGKPSIPLVQHEQRGREKLNPSTANSPLFVFFCVRSSSGSRIIVTLVHLLKSGEYGVAGVCNVSVSILPPSFVLFFLEEQLPLSVSRISEYSDHTEGTVADRLHLSVSRFAACSQGGGGASAIVVQRL